MSEMDIDNEVKIQQAMETIQDAEFVERTPEIVAAEICQIKDQTRKLVLNNSIEIGKRLCEAKEMVPHGEWGTWLERNVDYKQSTANKLMKIYEQYGSAQGELWGASAKSETFTNLTYSKALALLAVPADEREDFVKKNDVENMSTRELQDAIRARDEAIKARDDARKELDEAVKSRETVIDGYLKQSKNEIDKIKKERDLANKKLQIEIELHDKLKNAAEAVKEKQEEEIERLKEELAAAEAKETEPSAETQAIIDALQKKLAAAEKLGMARLEADEEVARFKILFELVQNNFSDLMEALKMIKNNDLYKMRLAAVRTLLEKLSEVVNDEA